MITIPNQSSVAKTYEQFDESGRMKPSAYYDRIVDVTKELVKFTLLTREELLTQGCQPNRMILVS